MMGATARPMTDIQQQAREQVDQWIKNNHELPEIIAYIPTPYGDNVAMWQYIREVERLAGEACIHWNNCDYARGGCCEIMDNQRIKYRYCHDRCQERTYRARGVGDTVKKIINTITLGKLKPKKGCGCNKRRKKLNKILPYDKKKGGNDGN